MVNGKVNNSREVDFEEVGKLLDALALDLEKLDDESRDVQRLKDEVQTLKNVLHSPVRRPHWVRDGLRSIREVFETALDTAVADGLKGSQYLTEIGRILGM